MDKSTLAMAILQRFFISVIPRRMAKHHVHSYLGASSSSWILSLSTSVIVLSAAGSVLYFLCSQGRSVGSPNGEQDRATNQKPRQPPLFPKRDATMPSRFPWEDRRQTVQDDKANSQKSSLPPPQTSQRQHEEDFLASMTFAQTGLRTPSCPCCQ